MFSNKLRLIISFLFFGLCIEFSLHASIPQSDASLYPLAIIHINDFHARFDQTNKYSSTCKEGEICIGGYARTLTVVKQLLNENADKNPIYLNIGDNFQGTLWYSLLGWNVTSHFLNYLPADATTLGNHEFDKGIAGVLPFIESLKSPILVANIDDSQEPSFQGKYNKSIVIERSGRKIGLIGLITVDTVDLSSPGKLAFLDPIESVKEEAEKLKEKDNVDIIVVLSHCGLEVDRLIAAEGGENIDVIVGGHSHSLLYTGNIVPGPDKPEDVYPVIVKHPNEHKVLIVQASAFTKYIGNLTVYFDGIGELQQWEGNPVYLDNHIEEDPEIKEALKPWKTEVEKYSTNEIGVSEDILSADDCCLEECELGDLITDAYMDYYAKGNGVDAVLQHCGGIRTGLGNGTLTYDDLTISLPFQDTIDNYELQGKVLISLLETAISRPRRFIQVSGLKITYDKSRPVNSRVVSVEILCRKCEKPTFKPLQAEEWYRIASPFYFSQGGDGFNQLKNKRNYNMGDKFDVDVIQEYLKKKNPLQVDKDGRIRLISKEN